MEKQKKNKGDKAFIAFCIIAVILIAGVIAFYTLLTKGIINIG